MVWLICIISDEEFVIEAEAYSENKEWITYTMQSRDY